MNRSVDKFDTPSSVTSSAVKDCLVRIADIDVHRTEGLLCSLSFESERYSPQAYNGDDIAL